MITEMLTNTVMVRTTNMDMGTVTITSTARLITTTVRPTAMITVRFTTTITEAAITMITGRLTTTVTVRATNMVTNMTGTRAATTMTKKDQKVCMTGCGML